MKIIHDVLSPELIAHCNGEIDFRLTEESWTFSNNNWDPYLYKGIPGTCLASEVSKGLKLKVLAEVRRHLPLVKHDKYHLNYHYWLHNSGVQWHEDKKYVFGATLYLNNWKKEWGGLFLWQDNITGYIHGQIPKPGTIAIVDQSEFHSVTQISPFAPYPRRAIQIWGMK